jgi:hypothetical protein
MVAPIENANDERAQYSRLPTLASGRHVDAVQSRYAVSDGLTFGRFYSL